MKNYFVICCYLIISIDAGVGDRILLNIGWVQCRIRMNPSRMCTTHSIPCRVGSLSRVISVQGVSVRETPEKENGIRDRDAPGSKIGPDSQTGSHIIQRPHPL